MSYDAKRHLTPPVAVMETPPVAFGGGSHPISDGGLHQRHQARHRTPSPAKLLRFVGTRPHTCRDGRVVELTIWARPCLQCGEWFEQTCSHGERTIDLSRTLQRCVPCRAARRKKAERV